MWLSSYYLRRYLGRLTSTCEKMSDTVNSHRKDVLSNPWRHYICKDQRKYAPAKQQEPVFPAHALTGLLSFVKPFRYAFHLFAGKLKSIREGLSNPVQLSGNLSLFISREWCILRAPAALNVGNKRFTALHFRPIIGLFDNSLYLIRPFPDGRQQKIQIASDCVQLSASIRNNGPDPKPWLCQPQMVC